MKARPIRLAMACAMLGGCTVVHSTPQSMQGLIAPAEVFSSVNFVAADRRLGARLYGTGTWYPGEEARRPDSSRQAARAASGAVSVVILSADAKQDEDAALYAEVVARAADFALREIWPGEGVSAEFELLPVGGSERVSRVAWHARRSGGPLRLRYYIRDYALAHRERHADAADTPIHELYHVLTALFGVGVHDQRSRRARHAAYSYEEITAFLFAQCAVLDATGQASVVGRPWGRVHLPQAEGDPHPVIGLFDDEALTHVVGLYRAAEAGARIPDLHLVYSGVRMTLWSELSGGAWTIEAGTPQADALLAACRHVAPDPWRVGPWLEALASDGVDAPAMPPRPPYGPVVRERYEPWLAEQLREQGSARSLMAWPPGMEPPVAPEPSPEPSPEPVSP